MRVPSSAKALAAIVAAMNLGAWALLLLAVAPRHGGMLGLGALAFLFGLRHAFDADHISAIDNISRRLMAVKKPAEGVGLYFSLGHSTVVAALALALAVAARLVAVHLPALRAVGGVAGALISGAFLYAIAFLNLGLLREAWRRPSVPSGAPPVAGPLTRLLRGVFRHVDGAPRTYAVGALFGLGLDTASEVALLALSAGAASRHLPLYAVMDLPLLFAAGMALLDTADGVLMTRAYGWALASPGRRRSYNLAVTALAVAVAFVVGSLELAQVVAARLHVWSFIQRLDLTVLGAGIVGLFAALWAGAYALSRLRRAARRWAPDAD